MRSQILLEQEILNLGDRSNLCLIYDKDPLEQMPALIPYIKQGLENNEQFIYITDEISLEQLSLLLKLSHIDVRAEIQRGSLKLWSKNECLNILKAENRKDNKILSYVQSEIKKGFTGVRIAVEMNWVLCPDFDTEKVEEWKATLQEIMSPDLPATILYQYNRSKLDDYKIKQAFRSHPHAIVDSTLCENHYYNGHAGINELAELDDLDTSTIIDKLKGNYDVQHKTVSKDQPINFRNIKWGSHICHFYNTSEELTDILVPYHKAGLESNEYCIWVTSKPLGKEKALQALRKEIPNLDYYFENNQFEILDASSFYMKDNRLRPLQEVLDYWINKEKACLAKGFRSLRVSGNTYWLEKRDWEHFDEYENQVNMAINHTRMIALCSYCLDKCSPSDIVDVVSSHQLTLIKKNGRIRVIENSESAKADIKIINAISGLEQTIQHRTAELTKSLEEKSILLKEIHHRVKNNLQIVTSLLRLQSYSVTDNKILQDCQNRIQSMALVHEALYNSDNLSELNMGNYIKALGEELFKSYNMNSNHITFEVNVDNIPLDLDKSISCGLILNELITNSIKYAFTESDKGKIQVSLISEGDRARLVVSDDGVGLSNGHDINHSRSLGMKLIKTFTSQLDGNLEIKNGQGLTFNIDFPLEEVH